MRVKQILKECEYDDNLFSYKILLRLKIIQFISLELS